jgi:nitrate/nitrite transport system permease protein
MTHGNRMSSIFERLGTTVVAPILRSFAGDAQQPQLKRILVVVGGPLVAFSLFLAAWAGVSQSIVTKYGTLPAPAAVWQQAGRLVDAHFASRARRAQFEDQAQAEVRAFEKHARGFQERAASLSGAARQELLEKAALLDARAAQARERRFSEGPTYLDQIETSLKTVFAGFLLASLVAIPLGILCGLSQVFQAAMNPLIQIFKPVSPLAWLPIVMIVVGSVYTTDPREAWFERSFISSAFTVALCSLWPTLVNTALGVASVDKDHMNVARVLRLSWLTTVRKIVMPSALPMMFAGLRISLGVGWMVLIAAEMLAQNPGLGKFVWDMFQNGSSETLAQIMVAVFTIGVIGFLLDRVMVALQRVVSYDSAA